MTAIGFDPLAIYWIAAMFGMFGLWCFYVIISEREYWRGFKAGKRVTQNNHSERSSR